MNLLGVATGMNHRLVILAIVPWAITSAAWLMFHNQFEETTDFERFFGTDSQWHFMTAFCISWFVSGGALVASALSLVRKTSHRRAAVFCFILSGVFFLPPLGLIFWLIFRLPENAL